MGFFRKYRNDSKFVQKTNNDRRRNEISTKLKENVEQIHTTFSHAPDLIVRTLVIKRTKSEAALIYLNDITDKQAVFNHVLNPLLFEEGKGSKDAQLTVSLGQVKQTIYWSDIENAILNGESVLFIDHYKEAYIFHTPKFPERSIEDSPIEFSLSGAHVGFTESGGDNVAIIRKYIQNKQLKIKQMTVGKRRRTKISIIYLQDVVNLDLVKELEQRINHLDVDTIINAGTLAEYIEDNPFSPFPQLLLTERPDFAANEILQGRITVVVDGSPNVIIAPVTFDTFFKTMDDYSSRWMVASFIRIMRYFGFSIAIHLPALYIATISFHFEVLPLELLLSLGESRERVPFPSFIEAFIMEIILEMLREAGVRLPLRIGQTVGIVGGIVIGQAAVDAGIVSNVMVIVVALTAIASFIIPNYEMAAAIRMLRFPMMILASLFGFVGITIGFMLLVAHFMTLNSLGMPYGNPFAPLRLKDWNDFMVRIPHRYITKRPMSTDVTQLKKAKMYPSKGDGS